MGSSDASGDAEPPDVEHEGFRASSAAIRAAFQGLGSGVVARNIPHFLRGASRNSFRLAMEGACQTDPHPT